MRYRSIMAARTLSRSASSRRGCVIISAVLCVLGCARTPLGLPLAEDAGPGPADERCNLLDDDRDLEVDEDFRDAAGNYVHAEHCGACGRACSAPIANAERVGCGLVQGVPSCIAERCADGYGPTHAG